MHSLITTNGKRFLLSRNFGIYHSSMNYSHINQLEILHFVKKISGHLVQNVKIVDLWVLLACHFLSGCDDLNITAKDSLCHI